MILALAKAQETAEAQLRRPLTFDEGDSFRSSIRASHLAATTTPFQIRDQDGVVVLQAGPPPPTTTSPPLTAAQILQRLGHGQLACTASAVSFREQQPLPPPKLLAQGETIVQVHSWSRWEKIRFAVPFLLLGLCLGALCTASVALFQDARPSHVGARP